MVNIVDCEGIVKEFEIQSRYHVQFKLWESYGPFTFQAGA